MYMDDSDGKDKVKKFNIDAYKRKCVRIPVDGMDERYHHSRTCCPPMSKSLCKYSSAMDSIRECDE